MMIQYCWNFEKDNKNYLEKEPFLLTIPDFTRDGEVIIKE